MALGAYDATPLDMAAAYTVFANGGTRLSPVLVNSLRKANGDVVEDFHTDAKPVLDPRIAYIMTNMMEGVLNFGTGFPVRARGFNAPAAGKTGTSHDGWFAGYTSNVLCVVWVGFDDYSDIRLSGAQTAAPIWADFMKKAVSLPQYSDVKGFNQPSGVVDVQLDKATNRLATPSCPETYTAAFVAGTEPRDTCDQATGIGGFFSRIFGSGTNHNVVPPPPPSSTPPNGASPQTAQNQPEQQKKKGFFGKIAGIFKDDKSSSPPSKQPSNSGSENPH
jgi:penicillin-binding protein 1B